MRIIYPVACEGATVGTGAGRTVWVFGLPFSRMFREEMGTTLMDYVKQQRLFGAAREIREGRKILDTALDYGYETHSGFTRAFRAQFGYSPALLRAFHVGEAFEKGDWENMGLYLRETPVHALPNEIYALLFEVLDEAGTEYEKNIWRPFTSWLNGFM